MARILLTRFAANMLGLVTVYGAPEFRLWGALENAILID